MFTLVACGGPKTRSVSAQDFGDNPTAAATGNSTASVTPTASPTPTPTPSATPTATSTTASTPTTRRTSTPPSRAATPAPTPSCPYPSSGFDCDFQRRFAAAEAYWKPRPGTVGIVVRDRVTGAVWRNDYSGTLVWTAATVKLAMSVDLLLRDRDGRITLTAADRALIHNMLNWSDDNAADTLWSKYGKDDFVTRFPSYGLTGATFVPGFSRYWGYMKCTPNDLDRLMRYVLQSMPTDLRDYIVNEMKHVRAEQQWGVWGAGPAAQPGNKDGWSLEQGGWVINSVGFVGPGQRYTLSMMNSLNG